MRTLAILILLSIVSMSYAQEEKEDMQTILDKLDKLEKLKVENETVDATDLLHQETTVSAVKEVTEEINKQTDTVTLLAEISFDTLTFEIGTINQGFIVKKNFTFTNTGTDDLEIISVVPDCSCTSSEWTEGVIKPGQRGFVSAEYDSHEDLGKFLKTITVLHTAGEGYTFLELSGFVAAKL